MKPTGKLLRRIATIILGTFFGGAVGGILGGVGGNIIGSAVVLLVNGEMPDNHIVLGGLIGMLFGALVSSLMLAVGSKIFPIVDKMKLGLLLGSVIGLFLGIMKGILIPSYQTLLNLGIFKVAALPSNSVLLFFIFDICGYVGPYVGMVMGFIITLEISNQPSPSEEEILKDKKYAEYLRDLSKR